MNSSLFIGLLFVFVSTYQKIYKKNKFKILLDI